MNTPVLHRRFFLSVTAFFLIHPVFSLPPIQSCEGYQAKANLLPLGQAANCLPHLADPLHVSDYDVCKTRPCFLFIRSSPVISFDTKVFNANTSHLRRPFPCHDPGSLHTSLRGVAFEILKRVTQRDILCIWAGPAKTCTFNALVDYTAVMAERGCQFAITGLLLDMPTRRCNHVPSATILDNRMVIIRKREGASKGPLHQLVRPFRLGSWLIVGAVLILFLAVSVITVLKMKSITTGSGFLTALQMFTGENDLPLYDDAARRRRHVYSYRLLKRMRNRGTVLRTRNARSLFYRTRQQGAASQIAKQKDVNDDEDKYFTGVARYSLSMTLFRISLATFFAVFALFYEVAVVNFLFQQGSVQLRKRLQLLSREELGKYAVLNNSALEVVWNDTVNKNGITYDVGKESVILWKRCSTGQECLEWVVDDSSEVQYAETYEKKGEYLIQRVSSCDKLAIIETKDTLYHFSSGWFYTRAVERDVIERIDREIVFLRMEGELSRLIENETGDNSCDPVLRPDIGASIILIPFGVLVLPFLGGSLLVLIFWGRKEEGSDENGMGDLKMQTSSESLESDLSSEHSSQTGELASLPR